MKIGFSGTYSSGKTTLLKVLSKYFKNSYLITESAREFDKNDLKNCETQYKILLRQIENELRAPHNCTVITDRTVIDNLAHTEEYCGYNRDLYSLVLNWIQTYDFIIFCHSDGVPLEDDGFRFTDPNFRIELENKMLKLYKNNDIKICEVKGSIEEQIKTILIYIKRMT